MNPSLANRLRIGFAITFALLAGVTVIGVGRLFQLRQDFEDDTTRSFQLEIAGEHLRQAFLVEQSALRGADHRSGRSPRPLRAARNETADTAAADARGLAEDDRARRRCSATRLAAERRWRQQIATPLLRGPRPPAVASRHGSPSAVIDAGDADRRRRPSAREALRDEVSDDTGKTALLVGVGLISGLIAAVLLFSGLIASMRRPLERLVDASGKLAERRPADPGRGRRPGRDRDPRHGLQRDGRRAAGRLPRRRGEPAQRLQVTMESLWRRRASPSTRRGSSPTPTRPPGG